jgi:hypothetical protein
MKNFLRAVITVITVIALDSHGATKYVNIRTREQSDSLSQSMPANVLIATPESIWDYRKADGWRLVDTNQIALPTPGWRVTAYRGDDIDGETARLTIVTQVNIADEAAAAAIAASNMAIQAVAPAKFPTGIEAPTVVLVNDDTGIAYGYIATATGDLVTPGYVEHASPTIDPATRTARKAAAMALFTSHTNRIAAIKADLDDVGTALDAIDVSTNGTMAADIAATSGATKTALTDTRKTLGDFKAAIKNLKQAAEKLRREIK